MRETEGRDPAGGDEPWADRDGEAGWMRPVPTRTRLTILGCGSSGGVPRIGADWGACDPLIPKNRRRRCSVLVERRTADAVTRVLVDTSPDLREQLLEAEVSRLDAVLYTHQHADHTHGIDDLRPLVLGTRRRLPVYADRITSELLLMRFGYCFEAPAGSSYPPTLEMRHLESGAPTVISGPGGNVVAMPFRVMHGDIDALGFRFGNIAYVPDVSEMPQASLGHLERLEILILDALRYTPHPTHFSVSEALALIERVRPKRAILTNLHTDLDYNELRRKLPAHVEPAYDGLQVEAVWAHRGPIGDTSPAFARLGENTTSQS